MRKIIILISVILLPLAAFAQDTTLTVTSDGKVGIGITNPSHKLVVNGNVQIGDIHTAYKSIEIDAAIPLANYNGTTSFIASTVPGSGIAKYAFHFKTNTRGAGTTQADLLVDGNVGIGTTTPQATLDVNGSIRTAAGQAFVVRYGKKSIDMNRAENRPAPHTGRVVTGDQFGYTFSQPPTVIVTGNSFGGWRDAIIPSSFSITTTGFDLAVFNSSNIQISGIYEFNWIAIGL